MSSSVEGKVLTLKSNDGEEFFVKESVAVQSVTIKNMIEDDCVSNAIPLTNLDSQTLAMVLEYLNIHGDPGISEDDIKNFDSKFINKEKYVLFDLISAANYLEISILQELLCQTIADKIRDFTVEEAREYFGVDNDYTPEEEDAIRKENEWAFR